MELQDMGKILAMSVRPGHLPAHHQRHPVLLFLSCNCSWQCLLEVALHRLLLFWMRRSCCYPMSLLPAAIAGFCCRRWAVAGGAGAAMAAAAAGCWRCIAGGAHNGREDAPPALSTCRGCHLDLLHLVPVSRLKEFSGKRERGRGSANAANDGGFWCRKWEGIHLKKTPDILWITSTTSILGMVYLSLLFF